MMKEDFNESLERLLQLHRDAIHLHSEGLQMEFEQAKHLFVQKWRDNRVELVDRDTITNLINRLALEHRDSDPATSCIYVVKHIDEDNLDIRFLEVTDSVETTNNIIPFKFAPRVDSGILFTMSVAVIGEEEHESLKAGDLDLPDGWGSFRDLMKIDLGTGSSDSTPSDI